MRLLTGQIKEPAASTFNQNIMSSGNEQLDLLNKAIQNNMNPGMMQSFLNSQMQTLLSTQMPSSLGSQIQPPSQQQTQQQLPNVPLASSLQNQYSSQILNNLVSATMQNPNWNLNMNMGMNSNNPIGQINQGSAAGYAGGLNNQSLNDILQSQLMTNFTQNHYNMNQEHNNDGNNNQN